MNPRQLIILGVTGSIGTQALDVVRAFPTEFALKGISGYSNLSLLAEIATEFKPPFIAVPTEKNRSDLQSLINYDPEILVGDVGLIELVNVEMDQLLVAIVGTAALAPVVAAIPKVNHIAIANKEVLVAAGSIIMSLAKQHGVRLIPVDSEHSALFQCLAAVDFDYNVVRHVTLTASGGLFGNVTRRLLLVSLQRMP